MANLERDAAHPLINCVWHNSGDAVVKLTSHPRQGRSAAATQDPNPTWTIQEFLQCLKGPSSAEEHPCFIHWRQEPPTSYILSEMNLTLDCDPIVRVYNPEMDPLPPNAVNFWQSVGSFITYIHFDRCQLQADFPHLFEKMVVDMMPNLECVKVTDCHGGTTSRVDEYKQQALRLSGSKDLTTCFKDGVKQNAHLKMIQITGKCPTSFYRLVLNAPNLEELVVSTGMSRTMEDYNLEALICTLEYICRKRDPSNQYSLKRLDLLDLVLDDGYWRSILILPKLQQLAVNLYLDRENQNETISDVDTMLTPLIRNHYGTLEVLKVFRPPLPAYKIPKQIQCPFPALMMNLRELHLWGNVVGSFEFLLKMPNLRTLVVSFRCHGQMDKLDALYRGRRLSEFRSLYKPPNANLSLEFSQESRMEHLERFNFDVPLALESLQGLEGWFPKLKVLEVVLDRMAFEVVCSSLTGLEELVLLYGSQIDDDVLTGWTEEEGKPRNPNNLTALKGLKRFEMKQVSCNGVQGRLGVKSVYEGFLKMDSLKTVRICVSEKMTTYSKAALMAHVNDVELIREHHMDEQRECCHLKKFYEEIENDANRNIASTTGEVEVIEID